MSKQILYIEVTNTIKYVGKNSGIQKFTREVVKQIWLQSRNNYQVVLLYYVSHFNKWIIIEHEEFLQRSDSALTKNPFAKKMALRSYIFKKAILSKFKFTNDSIFLQLESAWNNPVNQNTLLSQLKQLNIQSILFVHDLLPLTNPEYFNPEQIKKFKNFIEAHFKLTSQYICNSRYTSNELANQLSQNPSCKINSIKMGTNNFAEHDLNSNVISKLKEPYFLCVGTIEIRKNHSTVLEAFETIARKNKKLNLVFVGKLGWKNQPLLVRIRASVFRDRIKIMEQINDQQLLHLYKNAIASISASFAEGYGMTVSESLDLGVLTICSNIPAHLESSQGSAIYFEPQDSRQLAKLMEKCQTDNEYKNEQINRLNSFKNIKWSETAADILGLLI